MEEKLKREINQILSNLYLLNSNEIKDIINSIQNIPVEGLKEIVETLEKGKKRQDLFLKKRIKNSPDFLVNLKRHMNKEVRNLSLESESLEKEIALKEIENEMESM